MIGLNGAALAPAAAIAADTGNERRVTVTLASNDKQLPSDETQNIQAARALKIKRAQFWAIMAFADAKARWISPHERAFTDHAPIGCGGKILAVDAAQERAEAKIEMQRALRNAPDLYFLEAAE